MAQLTTPRAPFAAALKHGSAIVERGGAPVLGNARLAYAHGRMSLAFTDAELWMMTSVAATSDSITVFTLPADRLSQTAAALEGADLLFSINGAAAVLSSGRARLRLPTLPADQYPELPEVEPDDFEGAVVDGAELAAALTMVSYAIPSDGAVYSQSIRFDGRSGGEIALSAHDGTRLAVCNIENTGEAFEPFSLPLKAVRTISKLADVADRVRFFHDDKLATFDVGDWLIRSKLAVASPSADRFVALAAEREGEPIWFNPREVERALSRMSIVADRHSRGVVLQLEADKLTLTLSNAAAGEAVEEISVAYDGEPQRLGFSLQFLRDAVRAVPGDDAEMHIGATIKRATITARPEGNAAHIIGPFAV